MGENSFPNIELWTPEMEAYWEERRNRSPGRIPFHRPTAVRWAQAFGRRCYVSYHKLPAPLVRVVKYGGIDTILFPLSLLVMWLSTDALGYQLATVAGFFAHITLAFFINRRWTFRKAVPTGSSLLTIWLIGATDLAIAVEATTLLVEHARLDPTLSRIVAGVAVFAWDYTLVSLITFRVRLTA